MDRGSERRAVALIAAAALTLGAGCGSDAAPERAGGATTTRDPDAVVDIAGTEPVGEQTAGSVAQLVDCRDWKEADAGERLATIADVRSQINLEDSGIEGPALSDAEAAETFDNACRPAYAAGFRLYKLYARAAGFITLIREIEARE